MYSIVGIDKKNVWRRNWYNLHICKDSVQNKDPTYLGPVLVEQRPQCNREWDRNPTRQAVTSGLRPQFDGPPSMKVKVLSLFLLSEYVSKIFTL
jgi:hypothetical protein